MQSEAELQERMIAAIRDGSLLELIVDKVGIATLDDDVENHFPILSIDRVARRCCMRNGGLVLSSFNQLKLLTGDENVSISKGEVLRPDIVCYSVESESLTVFELKKTGQTAREAITELLAYEHELKNQIPFLGNCDINFVLVSMEWTTLMDHSVASAVTWSGKRILCLEASLEHEKLVLQTRIPNSWKITGSTTFPPSSVSAVTISLYDFSGYGESGESESSVDPRLITAMSVMAREGDRTGANGFALLWRDHWDKSSAPYAITLCGVSPFSFYEACRESGLIGDNDGKLVEHLDSVIEHQSPSGHGAGLMAIAKSAQSILDELSRPELEGFTTWTACRQSLLDRAEPIRCEFWGTLGDHTREFILSPSVRKHARGRIANGLGDWTHPWVGIPILDSFFGRGVFQGGNVVCSSAYKLGRMLGSYRVLGRLIDESALPISHIAHRRFEWNAIDLFSALDELSLLATSAENIGQPPQPPFVFSRVPHKFSEDDWQSFLHWIGREFLGGDQVHELAFAIGLEGCMFLEGEIFPFEESDVPEHLRKRVRTFFHLVSDRCETGISDRAFWDDTEGKFRMLQEALGLASDNRIDDLKWPEIRESWETMLELGDKIFESVFHKQSDLASTAVDWEWLRQGVEEARARGDTSIGILLGADGTIGTGKLNLPFVGNLMQPCDPKTQVYFWDMSHGFGMCRIVTWDELKGSVSLSRVGKLQKPETG